MDLTVEDLKLQLNFIHDDTFDEVLNRLLEESVVFVQDRVGFDCDLSDRGIQQIQYYYVMGMFDEREVQFRNHIDRLVCTAQAKYRYLKELEADAAAAR